MYRAFPEGYRESSCRLHGGGCGVETTRGWRGRGGGKGSGGEHTNIDGRYVLSLGDQPPCCTRLIYYPRLWLGRYRIRRRSGRSRVPIESCIKTTMPLHDTTAAAHGNPSSAVTCRPPITGRDRGKKFLHLGGKFFRLRRYVVATPSCPSRFYCGRTDMSNDPGDAIRGEPRMETFTTARSF